MYYNIFLKDKAKLNKGNLRIFVISEHNMQRDKVDSVADTSNSYTCMAIGRVLSRFHLDPIRSKPNKDFLHKSRFAKNLIRFD